LADFKEFNQMVSNKNNKNNLYIKTDEDKFVNKKIGKTFQNF
jgi:hypothetical protein